MPAHLECDHRQRQDQPNPEPACHVDELGARSGFRNENRFERHAADRTIARADLPDLRMHRAGVDRACGRPRWLGYLTMVLMHMVFVDMAGVMMLGSCDRFGHAFLEILKYIPWAGIYSPCETRSRRPASSGSIESRARYAAFPAWSKRTAIASTSSRRSPPFAPRCGASRRRCYETTSRIVSSTRWPPATRPTSGGKSRS